MYKKSNHNRSELLFLMDDALSNIYVQFEDILDDKNVYYLARALRSHGMSRELGNKVLENRIAKKYKKLSPKFIFLYPAYNFRNNEINATIGINQLKSLDKNNERMKSASNIDN